MVTKGRLRTCEKGHKFYKSSDCPVCPVCERERKPECGFLSLVSAPARRALERKGILTLEKLSTFTVKEILELHGVGPSVIPKLQAALEENKMTFKSG